MPEEVLSWGAEGGLDVQGEGAQTPSAGVLENGQLQDVFVQVHGDVSAQLIGEVMQQLKKNNPKNSRMIFFFLQVINKNAILSHADILRRTCASKDTLSCFMKDIHGTS